MKQPKSLQPSIYKACSDLYIWKLSKMGLYIKVWAKGSTFFAKIKLPDTLIAVYP